MPTYDYVFLQDDGSDSEEFIEIVQSMREPHLKVEPISGRPIRRVLSIPLGIQIDPSLPKTIGTLAEKNTAKMKAHGDSRIKPPAKLPWWRDGKKSKDFSSWSPERVERYIFKGD